jgi:hypothetical protein
VAVRELRVSALRPAVGELNGSEELRLKPVRAVLVELLVRGTEIGEREPDLLDCLGEAVDQLPSRFCRCTPCLRD